MRVLSAALSDTWSESRYAASTGNNDNRDLLGTGIGALLSEMRSTTTGSVLGNPYVQTGLEAAVFVVDAPENLAAWSAEVVGLDPEAARAIVHYGQNVTLGWGIVRSTLRLAAKGGLRVASNVAKRGGEAIRYGPLRRGPLPDSVANTFRSGSYTGRKLEESTTLYRVHGGTAEELGQFWTRTPPAGPLQSKIDLALDPVWGNTAEHVTKIRVPAGTTVYEGAAAAQGGLIGGGSQVVIPRVDPGWIVQ